MMGSLPKCFVVWFVFVLLLMSGPVLLAQAAEVATGAPVPPATTNEWGGSLVWAFFSSSGLEWLKRHEKISLISQETGYWVQRILGVVVAAAAALGVHYTYDPTAGALTITGLTAVGVWTMVSETLRTWVMQEITYRVAVKEKA